MTALARLGTRGHTLLELTLSMALSIVVVLAALSLYRGQRAAFERAADTARMHEAGVAALDLIAQQMQMAGFATESGGASALFGCSQGRVAGVDAVSGCETLASRSDGVLVRYAADTVSTWPNAAGAPTDCLGQGASTWVSNRFYAKPSASTGEPELYCEGVGKQAQPLVEGVERLKIVYFLKGGALAVDAASIAPSRWPDVVAAELCVVVRGDLAGAGPTAKYIDCDGARVTATDARPRQSSWRHVAIRNAVGGGQS